MGGSEEASDIGADDTRFRIALDCRIADMRRLLRAMIRERSADAFRSAIRLALSDTPSTSRPHDLPDTRH